MVRKTRNAKTKGMTIPKLRKSFEHLDSFLQKRLSSPTVHAEFRKEWKKLFGKPVSEEAAKDYIAYMKASGKVQKGGAAPIDYSLRPGGPQDLNIPPYVSSGFGFANVPSFMPTQCGKENITPVLPAGLGSNVFPKSIVGGGRTRKQRKQRGGALPSVFTAISEMVQRPFQMDAPPSRAQDFQMNAKGVNLPTGNPVQNPLSHVQAQPSVLAKAST